MLISKWTELSIDTQMQTALLTDQGVIKDANNLDVEFVDAQDISEKTQIDNSVAADPKNLFGNETTSK